MDDCFALPGRGISRVAYGESAGEQTDPFNYHQGDKSTPNWDPYDFHQPGRPVKPGTDKSPGPVAPRPTDTTIPVPKPGDLPLPPLPDQQNPREVRLTDG